MNMNLARTSLVVAAFLVLSMSAFAVTGTQSSLSIQAEIPSIDALSCVNSSDGSQNLDFNFLNQGNLSTLTLGVTCTYSTNDPFGVDISLRNDGDLRGNLGGLLFLSDNFSVTDGTFGPLSLPALFEQINLTRGLAQNGAYNAQITYQLAMNLGPNVKSGNYSEGQITFILGPSQVN